MQPVSWRFEGASGGRNREVRQRRASDPGRVTGPYFRSFSPRLECGGDSAPNFDVLVLRPSDGIRQSPVGSRRRSRRRRGRLKWRIWPLRSPTSHFERPVPSAGAPWRDAARPRAHPTLRRRTHPFLAPFSAPPPPPSENHARAHARVANTPAIPTRRPPHHAGHPTTPATPPRRPPHHAGHPTTPAPHPDQPRRQPYPPRPLTSQVIAQPPAAR